MPASISATDRRVVDRDPTVIDAEEAPIGALIGEAITDARAFVSAEVELYKARITERLAAYKGAAVFFAVAGILSLAALIALLVGLILSLATLIGPGLATAAVVLGTLAIAAVLAMIGKGRLSSPVTGGGDR